MRFTHSSTLKPPLLKVRPAGEAAEENAPLFTETKPSTRRTGGQMHDAISQTFAHR